MSTQVLKLITGEEIIGKVLEDNEEYISLSNVRSIELVENDDGLSVRLYPYMYSSQDAELDFEYEHIITYCLPDEELEKTYLEQCLNIDISASFGV